MPAALVQLRVSSVASLGAGVYALGIPNRYSSCRFNVKPVARCALKEDCRRNP